MHIIPNENIINWTISNRIKLPQSVDYNCPYCQRFVTFTIPRFTENNQVYTGRTRCNRCNAVSTFIYIGLKRDDVENITVGSLFIHPSPTKRRHINGFIQNEKIPAQLRRAYQSTINVYDAREWDATATQCRRALEGITKSLLSDDEQNRPLAQQITLLSKNVDLQKPLVTLAGLIKDGGNIGAHFDLEKETDEEMATAMVELIEYLLEYIFVLPERIESLKEKIEKLK